MHALVVVAACLMVALAGGGAAADAFGRPAWMPTAPPLEVKGEREVRVSTADEFMRAVREARDGDIITLAEGVHQLPRFAHLAGRSHVTIRGESDDPSRVVLRGKGFASMDDSDDILRLQGCSDVTIANLTFEECHSYAIKLEQLPYEGRRLEGVNIYHCNFRNAGMRAIKGTGGGGGYNDRGSIRYCNFVNTKIPPRTWPFEGDYITAIDCMRLRDWVIADNYFGDIRGATGNARGAVFVWVESENVVTERNVFVNCDNSICYGNPSGSSEGPAKPHNTGGVIRNNFIVGGVRTAIEVCWARDVKVYHNTILTGSEDGRAIFHFWRELSGVEIRNNIVRGRIWGDGIGVTIADNVSYGVQDAWFRDVAGGDLHLTAEGRAAVARLPCLAACLEGFDGQVRGEKTRAGADEAE